MSDITHNDNKTVTLTGTVVAATLAEHQSIVTKLLAKNLEVDGFRKGTVPNDVAIKKIGEARILHEASERAIAEHYPTLLAKHDIKAIGRPDIEVTKIAPGNDLEYKATTAVLPEFTLPDYTKIAQQHTRDESTLEVTDTDMEEALENLTKNIKLQKGDAEFELTDESVKELGPFENLENFKEELKKQLANQKQQQAAEKQRLSIIEAILAETDIAVPDVLIESELGNMFARLRADAERMGGTMEGYLEQIKKTEEELREEWRPDAEKRAQTQLILNEIAVKEDISADDKEVEQNVNMMIMQSGKKPDEIDSRDKASAWVYVETIMTNEEVFKFLDGTRDEKKKESKDSKEKPKDNKK